jgi:hypothetical protein
VRTIVALALLSAGCASVGAAPRTVTSAEAAPCPALAGAAVLVARPALRWLIVGEVHGTAESPVAFGDLVCHAAARGRRPIVALEYPAREQAALDAYLRSRGSDRDRRALLARIGTGMADGRTSAAMLDLVERLRRMRRAGRIDGVVAVQPVGGADQAARASAMAEALQGAAGADPGRLVIALLGNVHAMKAEFVRPSFRFTPAAGHLPPAQTVSLAVRGNGGAAWNCVPECGPHDRGPAKTQAPRGIVLAREPGAAYDGALNLGVMTTASPPAR